MFYEELVLHFTVYAFLGYIAEVIYCSIGQKRLVNRGFLYGPFLPVYGFGGLIIYVLPDVIKSNLLLLFISGFVLTSILEYFTSWLLEKCFSVKLWDYTGYFCNINGRVCLLNSTLFGIMSIAMVNLVEPRVNHVISLIPEDAIHTIVSLISIMFSIDTTLSVMKMREFQKGLALLRAKRAEIEAKTKALVASGKKELAEELKTRLEEDLQRYRDGFVLKASKVVRANPGISARSEEIKRQLEVIAEWSKDRKALKKKYREDLRNLDDSAMKELRR